MLVTLPLCSDAARVAACEALFVMASQDQQARLQLLESGAVPAAIKVWFGTGLGACTVTISQDCKCAAFT